MSHSVASYISLSSNITTLTDNQSLTIPATNVKPLIKLLVNQGVNLSNLLKDTQIQFSELARHQHLLSFEQYIKLIKNARQQNVCPDYALQLGEQFFINHDGVLACRVMSSETPKQAMSLLTYYQDLFTQLLSFTFDVDEEKGVFTIKEKIPLGEALPHFIEYAFSAIFCLGRFCLGQSHIDLKMEFSYTCPSSTDTYVKFFQNPVTFNQLENRVIFDIKTLEQSILFSDSLSACENENLCAKRKPVDEEKAFINKVTQTLRTFSFQDISLEALASRLHMSPRSLRRRLHAQNVSYKSLLELEQKRLAIKYLENHRYTLDQIAHELGYLNASSFSRAFKRWFGLAPIYYQKSKHE